MVHIDRDKPYDEIEHALSDKSIDDVIVINEKKDARDINETTFKVNNVPYKTDFLSFDSLVYDSSQKSYIIIQNNKKEG